jgi:hypothetical protein
MLAICERAEKEVNYNPTTLIRMVTQNGGPQAAKQLLHAGGVSYGFVKLERKRLDLSVEQHVLMRKFQPLFSTREIEIARERLRRYSLKGPVKSPRRP